MWRPDPSAPVLEEDQFRLLRELVHEHSGLWFREDMAYLVERRLGARVAALGLRGFEAYHRFLLHDPGRAEELEQAVELLTTNETYLFREPRQLDAFAGEILPRLASDLKGRRQLRLLSAGCSTGEEAYTAAVLVRESGLFGGWDVEVIGCDLSRRCLAQAKAGAYAESAFRSPEAERLRRWFQLRGGKWVVDDQIRRGVRFVRDNLLAPRALSTVPPLDVVFCRNVMIYFDTEARRKALRRLYARMRPGAWLLLGHSESLLGVSADFELVHLREELAYRRPPGPPGPLPEEP
jgi:chemotaxis protein methyltransferase CheR